MSEDPRVEAVARAAAGEHWLDTAPMWCEKWREYARKLLAAADAVDPMRPTAATRFDQRRNWGTR